MGGKRLPGRPETACGRGRVVLAKQRQPDTVDTPACVDLIHRELGTPGHVDPGGRLGPAHRAFDRDQARPG
jgi:hypothetical protein